MADSLASIGAQVTAASPSVDPIQLHAQAINALSRIMRELRAPGTDYELVNSQLARATDALKTLCIIDAHFTH